ncbi:MAG: LPS-assembly protein LptD [Rhodospirillaceae bacterium]|jgi:LPS-assembly protein|nr:LPS-assembly protein LptD [Rhodospirillaceae bacterium]MBT4702232.1 LPS-assembly protein LptD [Rhodospirillaceae bacterium]MBT5035787.1 LPS-assembly protein LptD [Rhodospirillaceae bacterium]MBT6218790.1 LPS-assembly protein LptD [Rhodospirillaceae bacterium]MBT8003418.1 LPS-assembly protein LptD [Rhodospirillales bacterium]
MSQANQNTLKFLRRFSAVAVLLCLLNVNALAQTPAPTDEEPPVSFSADQMTFDRKNQIITATGKVEVSQEGRLMYADDISYDQKADVLTATGNVSILEPNGDVIFAKRLEVTGDMKDGIIEDIGLILADKSRFAATGARRSNANILEMRNAVYSPCNLCEEDPTAPPFWQLRAVRIIHDKSKQRIEYRDATLEIFGVPVAYTPYFAHPDPTVKRRSGLLIPKIGNSSDLGTTLQTPYYFALNKRSDLTVTPIITTKERAILALEYREFLKNGRIDFRGSLTYNLDNEWRGHMGTKGRFDIDQTWRWGFDVNRSIDGTYIRRYGFESDRTALSSGSPDSLVTHLFTEGFRGRNYISANAYAFQGLEQGDKFSTTPLVAPLIDYNHVGQPDRLGGRTVLDVNLLALTRTGSNDTRRLSIRGGWEVPFFTSFGDAFKLSAKMLGDFYNVGQLPRSDAPEDFTGFSGRLLPELTLSWRHPFVRQQGSGHQVIEPIASVVLSPYGGNTGKIPNEDSVDFEFDDTNLFRSSRFSGLDRVESGPRINYGLKWDIYGRDGGSTGFLIGQSYRVRRDNTFAALSGLEDHFSDIVARVQVKPIKLVDLTYRTRISKENLSPARNEIEFTFGAPLFRVGANYLFLDRQEDDEFSSREEISMNISSQLNRNWRTSASAVRDLAGGGQMRAANLNVSYENECCLIATNLSRTFFEDRDLTPTDSITFRVTLKTLGAVQTGTSLGE